MLESMKKTPRFGAQSPFLQGVRKERAALNGSAGDACVNLQLIEALQKRNPADPQAAGRQHDHRRQPPPGLMLNVAGSSFDFEHVLFAVIQECEHVRRGLLPTEAHGRLMEADFRHSRFLNRMRSARSAR